MQAYRIGTTDDNTLNIITNLTLFLSSSKHLTFIGLSAFGSEDCEVHTAGTLTSLSRGNMSGSRRCSLC